MRTLSYRQTSFLLFLALFSLSPAVAVAQTGPDEDTVIYSGPLTGRVEPAACPRNQAAMLTELSEKIRLLEIERERIAEKPKLLDEKELGITMTQEQGRRMRYLETRVETLAAENESLKGKLREALDAAAALPATGEADSGEGERTAENGDYVSRLEARVELLTQENNALRGKLGGEGACLPVTTAAEEAPSSPQLQTSEEQPLSAAPPPAEEDREEPAKAVTPLPEAVSEPATPKAKTWKSAPAPAPAAELLALPDLKQALQRTDLPAGLAITGSPHNARPDFRYFEWKAPGLLGRLDQRRLPESHEYYRYIEEYLQKSRGACAGEFTAKAAETEIAATISTVYDIACLYAPVPYIESVLFNQNGDIFSIISVRTTPEQAALAGEIRASVRQALEAKGR